jgi:hypothetical protein
LETFYVPPRCLEVFDLNDASEICHKAISRWDGHVKEIAPILMRDREFLKVPHRDGCRKRSIFIDHSDVELWRETNALLCPTGFLRDSPMPDYITDFRNYVLAAVCFWMELRK